MEKRKIVVIGSCNTDMVIRVDHLPLPGETIIGYDFMTNQGGKGANQAVAVARLGGDTAFVARVGKDGFGEQSISLLRAEGIDTSHVTPTEGVATGVALIPVDEKGENSIIVASGANAKLSIEDIKAAEPLIREAGIVLMQLETPLETLMYAAEAARKAGALVVLNPAPFPKDPLPESFLSNIDLITPNETEASRMSGIEVEGEENIHQAIRAIQQLGVRNVIITAGGKGAYTDSDGQLIHLPASKTEVVDTTAAGDTFCGALCVALSEGCSLSDGIRFANRAAAISVTRMGAWRSIPRRQELLQ